MTITTTTTTTTTTNSGTIPKTTTGKDNRIRSSNNYLKIAKKYKLLSTM